MSKKHFSWLLVVTIVVAVLVVLIPGKTGNENVFESRLLLPNLAEQVNNLDEVRIINAGDTAAVSLQRKDDQWVVDQAAAYPANWEMVRNLLRNLAQAQIVENKTANPEYYSRLGVEDVAQADATGVKVVFGGVADIPSIIVGKNAQGRDGQYVRLGNSDQSALIGSQLEVPATAQQWLEREIIDVPSSEVVEFEITHADGETISASKVSADDADFVLHAIPDGREISSAWTVNQVGGALAALQLDSVRKADEIDWTDAVVFSLLTADGVRVQAQLTATENESWIGLTASAHLSAQSATESSPDVHTEDGAEDGQEAAPPDMAVADAGSASVNRAETINQRVSGWAYQIPSYKYDAMIKRMEDMLKSLEES